MKHQRDAGLDATWLDTRQARELHHAMPQAALDADFSPGAGSPPTGAIVPARGQVLVTQPVPRTLAHPFGTNLGEEYSRQGPGSWVMGDSRGLGIREWG